MKKCIKCGSVLKGKQKKFCSLECCFQSKKGSGSYMFLNGKDLELSGIVGMRSEKLVVVEEFMSEINPNVKQPRRTRMAKCLCDCGNIRIAKSSDVVGGYAKSCGCLTKDKFGAKHNMWDTPLYRVWVGMKSRCSNPRLKEYRRYGGRGIKVCELWKNDFMEFFNWAMLNGWCKGLDIDRYPNRDGGYEPTNCRIVTRKVNTNNKDCCSWHTINNETKTLSEWCEKYKITYSVVANRLGNNWDIEKALTIPAKIKAKRWCVVNIDYGIFYESIPKAALSMGMAYGCLYSMLYRKNSNKTRFLFIR